MKFRDEAGMYVGQPMLKHITQPARLHAMLELVMYLAELCPQLAVMPSAQSSHRVAQALAGLPWAATALAAASRGAALVVRTL